MNQHRRAPNPTEAEIAFARAEVACSGVSQDVAFERCRVTLQAHLDAYRDWAVCGAELPLLAQMGANTRDAMLTVYALAKNGLLKAEP
ncbi:MAG TPA: hypothetical protein PK677_11305 [Acidiphilium sp.]|nr:hypothetical protein [Acidiphilium sp.]